MFSSVPGIVCPTSAPQHYRSSSNPTSAAPAITHGVSRLVSTENKKLATAIPTGIQPVSASRASPDSAGSE